MLLKKRGVVSVNDNDRLLIIVREILCFRVRIDGLVKYCQANLLFILFNLYFMRKCALNNSYILCIYYIKRLG